MARAWLGERFGWWVIGAFPAVFSNIGHGQNGFLSAALMGGGALWLGSRPVLAGVCFGAMIWKPHLGLVIPVALIAARRWTTFAAAAVTALALVPDRWILKTVNLKALEDYAKDTEGQVGVPGVAFSYEDKDIVRT